MNSVIIVAGGSGKRMGTTTPKQFLLISGEPVLMHTIRNFYNYDPAMQIIVVLPREHHNTWNDLCQKYKFSLPHQVTSGGNERFYSVMNGLKLVSPDSHIIAVHDGVRPLTSHDTLDRCFSAAEAYGAAIPAVPLVDSIRHIQDKELSKSESVNRSEYMAVQTPQCFIATLLHKAYSADYNTNFTDDASVVEQLLINDEKLKHRIQLVSGNIENLKITTPADIILAEYYLTKEHK